MLGQLIASMGLLATGARVPAAQCTRLNVPCLISGKWIRVIIRSDINGLRSSALGLAEISVDETTKYPKRHRLNISRQD